MAGINNPPCLAGDDSEASLQQAPFTPRVLWRMDGHLIKGANR